MDRNKPILITGINGFLGTYCALELIALGFKVRGTVRRPEAVEKCHHLLASYLNTPNQLELHCVDLAADTGWHSAVEGVAAIMHVASPFPRQPVARQDALLEVAQQGTLRLLSYARNAGISRVVMTSSLLAVLEGNAGKCELDEVTWGTVSDTTDAYATSKILSEQSAWEYARDTTQGAPIQLTTILPGLLLGPVLSSDYSFSVDVIAKLMKREVNGCPPLGWCVADVRDVASAHAKALLEPLTIGKRYCCTGPFLWMKEMVRLLNHIRAQERAIVEWPIPGAVVRFLSLFDPALKVVVPRLNLQEKVSCQRITSDLGWGSRPVAETIEATARSLVALKLV